MTGSYAGTHVCSIAQIRNYRRNTEDESMNLASALRSWWVSRGCFKRYRACLPSVSYRSTSANRSAAKTWLTRDTLRPTARAISRELSLYSHRVKSRRQKPWGCPTVGRGATACSHSLPCAPLTCLLNCADPHKGGVWRHGFQITGFRRIYGLCRATMRRAGRDDLGEFAV